MASQALGRCPARGECRPGLPCSTGPSPLSRAFLLPLPEAQGGFSLMFTVGPGRAPGALEEQAATWCGGHMSGTRRQPVRAQGGCRPVASGERAPQQPGSRWGGAQALAPLDGSQALAHTVTAETARSSTRVGCFKKEEKGKGLAPALRTPRPRTPAPFRSRRCVSGLPCTAGRPLGTVLGAGPRAFPSLPS